MRGELCATNWDGTPWQSVALELKLTKNVTSDKRKSWTPLPRTVVERIPEVDPGRFFVLSPDIEARGRTGRCPGCAALHNTSIKTTQQRMSRMNHNDRRENLEGKSKDERMQRQSRKDRESEGQKKSSSRKKCRGCAYGTKSKQMADGHAVASEEDERQHDENRLRDIHMGKPDKLRKAVRFQQERSKYIVIVNHACVSGVSCEW